jgi:hypothetical protein
MGGMEAGKHYASSILGPVCNLVIHLKEENTILEMVSEMNKSFWLYNHS